MTDFILNSGRTVKYLGDDEFSRPCFEYVAPSGNKYTLCIVDGKMHSTTKDGEPVSPLAEGLQLRDYDHDFSSGKFVEKGQ